QNAADGAPPERQRGIDQRGHRQQQKPERDQPGGLLTFLPPTTGSALATGTTTGPALAAAFQQLLGDRPADQEKETSQPQHETTSNRVRPGRYVPRRTGRAGTRPCAGWSGTRERRPAGRTARRG